MAEPGDMPLMLLICPPAINLSYKCQHIKLFLHHVFFFGFIAALIAAKCSMSERDIFVKNV